jgi:hypothetical protein
MPLEAFFFEEEQNIKPFSLDLEINWEKFVAY